MTGEDSSYTLFTVDDATFANQVSHGKGDFSYSKIFHSLFSGITNFLFSLLKILKLSPMKDDISDNPFLLDPVMQRLVIATQLGRTSVEQNSYEKDKFSKNDIIYIYAFFCTFC